ncbi:MAG: AAA family ATPase [Cyanobacteria bacterium P01_F01_bin.86]
MIIAIAAIKGGVGKTTLTFCLAATLSQMGKKVLCLDLDHQGDLSAAFGAGKDDSEPTLGQILYAPKREQAEMLARGIIDIPGCCHLITPGSDLGSYQAEIENGLASENRLADALAGFESTYENYDYILLDTPKGEGLFTKNALVACENVIIPVQTEYFALKNIPELLGLVGQIADRANPNITVSALVPSRMKQTSLHKSIHAQLVEWDVREQLPHQKEAAWVAPPIKDLTIYAELSAQGESLYTYAGVKKAHRAPFVEIAKHLEAMKGQDISPEVAAVG